MPVKVKELTEEFDPIARYCYERFKKGLGVTIERNENADDCIYLIPEVALNDKGNALIITSTRGGVYKYKGERELDEFMLARANFGLQEGRDISKIVNALIKHFQWGSMNPVKEVAMPQLTKGEVNG